MFAQRRNLARPSFLRLLADIVRFNRAARRLVDGRDRVGTGADRLPGAGAVDADRRRVDRVVPASRPVLPIVRRAVPRSVRQRRSGRPIPSTFTRFPMRSYARFMHNHGLLGVAGPPAVAHDHRRVPTVRRSARRAVRAIASGSRRPCTRSSPTTGVGGRISVEVLTDRGPGALRPCDRRRAQRSGTAHARRREHRRAGGPRRDQLPAQHRDLAHRRTAAAAQPACARRAGTTAIDASAPSRTPSPTG